MRPAVINAVSSFLEKVAKGLIRDFGEIGNLQASREGTSPFVDVAVKRTEALIHDALHRLYPTANLWMPLSGLMEYGGQNAPVWIVNALDGQRNFSHGLPHFAMSLALKEANQLVAAVVYDPLRYETFWACRGGGAFLNQTRLRVSGRTKSDQALISTRVPRGEKAALAAPLMQSLATHGAGVQSWGVASLDLAYVASGRYEGFFDYDTVPHDIAAGILLAKEAGGMVSTPDGRFPSLEGGNDLIVGNPTIHGLLKLLFPSPAAKKQEATPSEQSSHGS
jgi:myo-inositol-1(or 4)-monophosphatase